MALKGPVRNASRTASSVVRKDMLNRQGFLVCIKIVDTQDFHIVAAKRYLCPQAPQEIPGETQDQQQRAWEPDHQRTTAGKPGNDLKKSRYERFSLAIR